MSDDLLSTYTQALAEQHDGAAAVPAATRARLLRQLAERGPRRSKWLVMGIPLLAVLGGSTAWAAASGQLVPFVQQASMALGIELPSARDTAAPSPPERGATGSSPPPALPKNEAEQEGAMVEERAEAEEEALSRSEQGLAERAPPAAAAAAPSPEADLSSVRGSSGARAQAAARAQAVAPKRTTPSTHIFEGDSVAESAAEQARRQAAQSREAAALAAYKAAHDAHFADGNCNAAILGYREYLERFPNGSFALEARYHRGLCLAQLGRAREARAVLQPFADGQYGDYRREKAAALIAALED